MATLHCQSITFIDDTVLIAATVEECSHDVSTTINLLESLGFHVNYGKSVLTASQCISYLVFIIDTMYLGTTRTQVGQSYYCMSRSFKVSKGYPL